MRKNLEYINLIGNPLTAISFEKLKSIIQTLFSNNKDLQLEKNLETLSPKQRKEIEDLIDEIKHQYEEEWVDL